LRCVVAFALVCTLLSLLLYLGVVTHSFCVWLQETQLVELSYEGIIIDIRKTVSPKLIVGSLERG
jgi:hypothetical protein